MAKKSRVLDPATQYATDVVDGRIIASRMVRLACRRHLDDLARAEAKSWVWDVEKVHRVINFFRDVLVLPENTDDDDDPIIDENAEQEQRPFVLTPFQQFIAGSLFGWYAYRTNKRGVRRLVRRFRVAYVETGKGSGKTPFGAGIMLYLLVADKVRGAQVFSAANTLQQAHEHGFTDAVKMVNASPQLKERVEVLANNIAVHATGSFMRPISSEKRGLDGKRIHGALIDEEHEHISNIVYLKVRAGTKGRPNALIFITTNSGFDLESVCYAHHDYSRQVLDGTIVNDAWFAFVCHLDSCDRCFAEGKWQPSDDCPACDDWKTEGPHWCKPNPNLGHTIQWDYLREQVQEAIGIPSQRNMVRRLNFGQWTQHATVFIAPEAWAACTSPVPLTLEALRGRACYLGLDLSDKIDLSACTGAFPRPLSAALPATAAAGEQALTCAVDVLSFFWMPARTIQKRSQEDKIPYVDWAQGAAPAIFTTPGAIIDHDAIVDFIITTLAPVVQIKGIGIDQAGAAGVVNKLRRHFGEDLVQEIPQGFRSLSEPTKALEALVVSGNVAHDGNPAMAMCVGNMGKEENHWREIRPVKLNQRKRIDGGVALVDALKVMQGASIELPFEGKVTSLADYL